MRAGLCAVRVRQGRWMAVGHRWSVVHLLVEGAGRSVAGMMLVRRRSGVGDKGWALHQGLGSELRSRGEDGDCGWA
jgi:hypothetical protein